MFKEKMPVAYKSAEKTKNSDKKIGNFSLYPENSESEQ